MRALPYCWQSLGLEETLEDIHLLGYGGYGSKHRVRPKMLGSSKRLKSAGPYLKTSTQVSRACFGSQIGKTVTAASPFQRKRGRARGAITALGKFT